MIDDSFSQCVNKNESAHPLKIEPVALQAADKTCVNVCLIAGENGLSLVVAGWCQFNDEHDINRVIAG